ncbi:MAG TPA: GNAT family N-acetyltransferase [Flavobacterium sp.]
MEDKLTINERDRRFELKSGEHTAFIEYRTSEDVYKLVHTEVPQALEGKGVGKQLVTLTINHLRENNLKFVPLCSFVMALLRRHPEWQDLVAER